MDDKEKREYNNLMRDLTNGNTDALNSAKDNMQFSSGLLNLDFSFYSMKMQFNMLSIVELYGAKSTRIDNSPHNQSSQTFQ